MLASPSPASSSARLRYSVHELLALSATARSLTRPDALPPDCTRSAAHSNTLTAEGNSHTAMRAAADTAAPSSALCAVRPDVALDEAEAVRVLRQLAGMPGASNSASESGGASGSVNSAAGSASSRWAVRDLGASTAFSADRAQPGGGSGSGAGSGSGRERGDDWRDRAAMSESTAAAASKRRWDATDRRLNGRYNERDRDGGGRGRDERYGAEAMPAWFTGDANAMAESAHDGQWHTADSNNATDDDALEPHSRPHTAQSKDEEATRFLFDKLGLSPVRDTEADSGMASLADTRPAWAVQAERELAAHRKAWSSSQSTRKQQHEAEAEAEAEVNEWAERGEQRETLGEVGADRGASSSDASLDDNALPEVSAEDASRAAALAAAIASDTQYDKLDAILAERASKPQQTDTEGVAAQEHGDEAKQYQHTREVERPVVQPSEQRHAHTSAARQALELIIPAQSDTTASSSPHAARRSFRSLPLRMHTPVCLFTRACRTDAVSPARFAVCACAVCRV